MATLTVNRKSKWKFETSATGGVGFGYAAGEGGRIYLKDPTGVIVPFTYGGAGAGYSAGLRLPKFGKVDIINKIVDIGNDFLGPTIRDLPISATISPKNFLNDGALFVLDTFQGEELTQADIQGVCLFVSGGGGLLFGVSAEVMVLGMSPGYLAAAMITPLGINAEYTYKMLSSATALLLTGGMNVGINASVGAAAFLGGLV